MLTNVVFAIDLYLMIHLYEYPTHMIMVSTSSPPMARTLADDPANLRPIFACFRAVSVANAPLSYHLFYPPKVVIVKWLSTRRNSKNN